MSPPFDQWFAGSQVVDQAGRPLVLFHGTNQGFESFSSSRLGQNTSAASSIAFFFSESSAEACEYAMMAGRVQLADAVNHERRIAELEAKLDQATRHCNWPAAERLYLELEELDLGSVNADPCGQNIRPVYVSIRTPLVIDMHGSFDGHAVAAAIKSAIAGGYDGLKVVNAYNPVDARPVEFTTTQWVAFDPQQVKSIFDPDCLALTLNDNWTEETDGSTEPVFERMRA